MFFIATITDKANAPQIREELRKAGFAYVPPLREWVAFAPTHKDELHILAHAHMIDGISLQERTTEAQHAIIEGRIAANNARLKEVRRAG